MAKDVITRFKLETTQYDSKLRDAAKGLQNVSKQAEMAGKDFDKFTKSSVDAARAFGQVASGATNTKDKLKDLVGAYNDVAKAYNSLTEQQRQSDFAKAMAESLDQLQDRIRETKQELYSLGDSAKGGGLFGENGFTGMLQVAGGNLLSKGVSMLAGEITDTIKQSIGLAKQGEGIRIAFERLGRPGLLDNLKEATHGTVSELELMKQAIKFENFKLPLEDLATYLQFAQQKAKDTGESIDFLVTSIVNGLGRQSKQILDNLGISASELTKRMGEGKDMTQAVAEIIREEMQKAGDYVETAADRAARAAAEATDKMEEMGRSALPVAEQFSEAWNTIKIGGMSLLNTVLVPIADSIRTINDMLSSGKVSWNIKAKPGFTNLADDPNIDDNGNYINKNWNTGNMKTFSAVTSISDIVVTGSKSNKKKKSGGSSKTKLPTIDEFNTALAKSLTGSANLKEVKEALSPYEMMLPEIKKNILDIKDADLGGSLAKIGDAKVKKEIEDITKKLDQERMAFQMAGQAASAFGAALAGIEDPSVKAAGTVIQAIANVALGFGSAVAQASSMGPYAWIAYVAAAMGAMATAISTVHSLTGYAEGGFVKGSGQYSGDNIPIMADQGELVLTRAQQGNLASQLQDTRRGGVMQARVSGENIYLALNNYLKRTGQGELLTWG